MGDGDDIRFPPAERREKPKFEPPPWEREQFEELARRQQQAPPPEPGPEQPLVQQADPVNEAAAVAEPEAAAAALGQPAEAAPAARQEGDGKLDEKHVELLMMGLRAEEPRPEREYHRVVIASGIVSILVGLTVTTWAIAIIAAPKKGGAGGPGSALFELMLVVFGLAFVIGGGVVVFRSLRQQGVL